MNESNPWEYHSGADDFESACRAKLTSYSPEEIVQANKFISLAAKIGQKYPFVFLPDFMSGFMSGVFTRKIQKKYNLDTSDYGYMIYHILNLDGARAKDPHSNNMQENLKNTKWKKMYDLVMFQSDTFHDELVSMLNWNILCCLVGHAVLKSKYLSYNEIEETVRSLYDRHAKDIKVFENPALRDSFDRHIHQNLRLKIDSTVRYLAQESYIISVDGDVAPPSIYSDMPDHIYKILEEKKDGTSYGNLKKRIMTIFPLFKISLDMEEFDQILEEFEGSHRVVRKRSFWKYSPNSDQLFTDENYVIKMKRVMEETERANADAISRGRTKFFGRTITPDQFISELKMLELGDLDDQDDQVTRITGLVLSDSAMLQSPREHMREFDFVVDLTNYNFRPEQEKMMRKFDFVVTSNIFHCKVMISTRITTSILSELAEIIPDGEQGIIFTCSQTSNAVLKQIKNDRTIQIINEDAIRDWCSITSTIPCRRHSVARIMYGEGIGKMVLVKSLNYESGLATVETTPNHEENTLPIGCLREVDLRTTESDDFEQASEEYFDFLCLLDELSSDPLENCLDMKIQKVHDTRIDFIKSTNSEAFGSIHSTFNLADRKYVEFDDMYTKINMGQDMNGTVSECKCGHKLNEEYYATLCKHEVAAMNHIGLDAKAWGTIHSKIELLKQKLFRFQEGNVARMIDALYYKINRESKILLKSYLQKYIDSD